MTFKKIWILSLGLILGFGSFTTYAFSPEEEKISPSRVVAFGKESILGSRDIFEDFVELATRGPERSSLVMRLAAEQFPEALSPKDLQTRLEETWKEVHWKSDPRGNAMMPFLVNFLLPKTARSSVLTQKAEEDDPCNMTPVDHRFFQMGKGILELFLEKDEAAAAGMERSPLEEHPGHVTILDGLENVCGLLSSEVVEDFLRGKISTEEMGPEKIRIAESFARAFYVFALGSARPDFYTVFNGAKTWASVLVAKKEWTSQQKKHFFYNVVSPAIEEKLSGYGRLSPAQLARIENLEDGKIGYVKSVSRLLSGYGRAYLGAYPYGGYFSKDERTLMNGEQDARHILEVLKSLYESLVSGVFSEKSPRELDGLLRSLLEDPGSFFSELKACFSESGEADFSHPTWGDAIFGWEKMEELNAARRGLYGNSNGK